MLENENQELMRSVGSEMEVFGAMPVNLQTLDLMRHAVIAPDGRRYVVASYDDTHLKNGYVTAVYPQQNGYLTLYRLMVYERSHETPEEVLTHHVEVIKAIQQGRLEQLEAKKVKVRT